MIKVVRSSVGFTLLEILMTLTLVGILAAVAITVLTSSVSDENFEATVREMNLIRKAMIGDASELTRGVRTSFGYNGDVGSLPTAIGDLITKPASVAARTVVNANRTLFGWNGPYLPTSDPGVDYTRDAWGNLYVWSPAAGTPTLVSLGSDGAAGGTGLAQDITMEFPLSVRRATVNGFIVSTGAGVPITSAASVTIYYPDGSGGSTSTTIPIAAASPGGAFSTSSVPVTIPFGPRSLTFTTAATGATVYGPVIFNVDRANYTVPVTLTDTGASCTTQAISFATTASSELESVTSRTVTVQASATCVIDMTVTVTLSDGTAIAPDDYTAATTTVTIPAGSTTQTFTATVINDTSFEPTETFVATLSAPSTGLLGANTTHTFSITNDDAPSCVAGNTILTTSGTFTMPANCTALIIRAWGAGGGGGQTSNGKSGHGGAGGYAFTGTLTVSPGHTFTVVVGTGGRGGGSTCTAGGTGAYAGGADGTGTGAPGVGPVAGGNGGAGGSFAGGQGRYGGGAGGAGSSATLLGGGGGGATSVTRDLTSTLQLIAGGGGGGGGGNNGGGGSAGAGGPGCGVNGENSGDPGRGGGGGGGACFAISGGGTANGTGAIASNSALTGGNADGGIRGGNCGAAAGGSGAVRFEYN